MIKKINYKKRYELLIKKARKRILQGFYEKHHIIPKCMGGDNHPTNICRLTSKEHYYAHYLLAKIYPNNHKVIYAFYMMCTRRASYRPEVSKNLLESAKKMYKKIQYDK